MLKLGSSDFKLLASVLIYIAKRLLHVAVLMKMSVVFTEALLLLTAFTALDSKWLLFG